MSDSTNDDVPPWLRPLAARIDSALARGAWAASCAAYEREGKIVFVPHVDGDALATVTLTPQGRQSAHTVRCQLGAVALMVAGGAHVDVVAAPDPDAIGWAAAAIINTNWRLPASPAWLRPLAADYWWLVTASDFRGASALPLSRVPLPALGGRTAGDALADIFSRSTIPGERERLRDQVRILGGDFRVTLAGAAVELFHRPEALSGADGGLALLEWDVFSRATVASDWTLEATSGGRLPGVEPPDRWAGLAGAVQKAAQEDTYGTGIHSPRSTQSIVSLDVPESTALLGRLVSEAPVDVELEIDDLLVSAGLTQRERDVVELMLQDLPQVEIAARLGIAPGTVAVHMHNTREKLRNVRRGV